MVSKQVLKEDLRWTRLHRSSSRSLSVRVLLRDHVGGGREEMRIRSPLARQHGHRRQRLNLLLRRGVGLGVKGEGRGGDGRIREGEVRGRGLEVLDEPVEGGKGLVAV